MHRRLLVLAALGALGCGESVVGTSADASRDDIAAGDASDGGAKPADLGFDVGFDVPAVDVPPPDAGPPNPVAIWELPRNTDPAADPLRLPWPNDLLRDAQGRVRISLVANQNVHPVVRSYLQQFDNRLDGFSPNGGVYFRFGMAVDNSTLPMNAGATRRAESTLQLVDVDARSPDRGTRIPLQWYYRETETRYWPSHTLAVAPVFGFTLRPRTRYAMVVTTGLRGAGGMTLRRDRDLDGVVATAAPTDMAQRDARTRYTEALDELGRAGVARDRVLSLAVFTTSDPAEEFFRAADWLRRSGPMPRVVDLEAAVTGDPYMTMQGHVGPNPIFQAGALPYNTPGSGGFVPDAMGVPQVQRMENLRVVITIPTGRTMPATGWPIAIYAHGTGGSAHSFVNDGTAEALAREGIACLGFDQIFHGERAAVGVGPEAAFFNFINPAAGRTNNRQGGLDLVQLGRFARSVGTLAVRVGELTVPTRIDPDRVYLFGHSQGGLNGPLWLAANDDARSGILSGAGGAIAVAILLKTEPVNIPQFVTSLLALEPGELVLLHPLVTLLQTLADPSDPINYARYIVREPRAGVRPHSVFQTEGFIDRYAPNPGIAALAMAIGLPLADLVLHPNDNYDLTGRPVAMLPLRGNLMDNMQRPVTGGWMQFDAPQGRDGHHVVFHVPGARLRASAFLGSAARDPMGIPTLPMMFE